MQSVFIVASGQHVGKTTLSLGLVSLLAGMGKRVHFFKPVGQEYVEKDGVMVDKDGCESEYAAKEKARRDKTKGSVKLD